MIDCKSPISVVVIIVNYRTPHLTIDCLHSLQNEFAYDKIQIVVADNDSQDDSIFQINHAIQTNQWNEWVDLQSLDKNRGFACGNNAIIRQFINLENPPPYFLLLNPDTILHTNSLYEMIQFMEQNNHVGIIGCKVKNSDGSIRRSAFRFHSMLGEFGLMAQTRIFSKLFEKWVVAPPMKREPHPVDWVSGAAMMIRREVFIEVGLLDENYFLYYEEVDFCWAARRAGWPCWYVPTGVVTHIGGQSTGIHEKSKPRPKYWFDSRRYFFCKNYGKGYWILANIAWVMGYFFFVLRCRLTGKKNIQSPHLLRDFIRFNFFNYETKK